MPKYNSNELNKQVNSVSPLTKLKQKLKTEQNTDVRMSIDNLTNVSYKTDNIIDNENDYRMSIDKETIDHFTKYLYSKTEKKITFIANVITIEDLYNNQEIFDILKENIVKINNIVIDDNAITSKDKEMLMLMIRDIVVKQFYGINRFCSNHKIYRKQFDRFKKRVTGKYLNFKFNSTFKTVIDICPIIKLCTE